jgi:hypothetical protein
MNAGAAVARAAAPAILALALLGCARQPGADPQTAATPVQDDPPARVIPVGGPYEEQHGVGACERDCALHEAGYLWAQEQGVTDAGQCRGDNESLVEGCEAWAADSR